MYPANAIACFERLNFLLNRTFVKNEMSEISMRLGNGEISIVRMVNS